MWYCEALQFGAHDQNLPSHRLCSAAGVQQGFVLGVAHLTQCLARYRKLVNVLSAFFCAWVRTPRRKLVFEGVPLLEHVPSQVSRARHGSLSAYLLRLSGYSDL